MNSPPNNEKAPGKTDPAAVVPPEPHEDLSYFLRVVREISNARSTEEIMAVVRHAAREIAGSDGATFVLRDGNECFYADEDAIAALWKGSRFPIENCISGWAMLNRQTVVIADIYEDPRIPLVSYQPTFVKSLVMVPIRTSFPVGAIGNYWATPHVPSTKVVEALEALASIVAVALENVGLMMNLERKIDELENANRTRNEFLMTLSHELRTPLNTIQGWSEQLKDEPHDSPAFKEGLGVISRSARHQGHLIDDLLDTTRILSGKLQIVHTPQVISQNIENAISSLEPQAKEKGIAIDFQVSDPKLRILGDDFRLQQVLANVLSNAIKFSSPGGRIEVRLSKESDYAAITVRDYGKGMGREFLRQIFQRFLQEDGSTTRGHGGLGIGLSIAKSLVEAHGGRIRAESEGLGHGSAISIRIPLLPDSFGVQEKATTPLPIPGTDLNGIKVLAIDDDEDSRDLLSHFLKKQGAEVVTADGAQNGLKMANSFQPDLIICDLSMPDEDGYSFIRKLRLSESEKLRKLPAIAFSAFTDRTYETQALTAGFDSFIPKPLDRTKFVADVLKVWRGAWHAV